MLSAKCLPTLPVYRENQQVVAPKNTLVDWHKTLQSRWTALWSRLRQQMAGGTGWTGLTLDLQVGSGIQFIDVSLEVQGFDGASLKWPDKRK